MQKKINVLSLFDGMSCGQIALNRCGIQYNNYYAAEIDKHAIKVTQHNYPNTIQLGNVTQIDVSKLTEIDLLIGGSPCQGFSFAGKQLNFNDPRSKLFFEYVRILKECKPKYFLLENVKMKKEYQNVISEHLGVEPININSNLVSAQNRNRLYWTNIPNVTIPEDKGILLKDILEQPFEMDVEDQLLIENFVSGRYYWNEEQMDKFYNKVYVRKDYYRIENFHEKTQCLMAEFGMNHPKIRVKLNENGLNRITFRKLTPIECERLQTVPDNYTSIVSNNQRYKMLGNGWTVDVIAHIFKNMEF